VASKPLGRIRAMARVLGGGFKEGADSEGIELYTTDLDILHTHMY
jgi:hypothetical protein